LSSSARSLQSRGPLPCLQIVARIVDDFIRLLEARFHHGCIGSRRPSAFLQR
jgi:hypothetical protein